MAKYDCSECNGTGVIHCSLEYGEEPHPDNCPVCGGDVNFTFPCPECSGHDDE